MWGVMVEGGENLEGEVTAQYTVSHLRGSFCLPLAPAAASAFGDHAHSQSRMVLSLLWVPTAQASLEPFPFSDPMKIRLPPKIQGFPLQTFAQLHRRGAVFSHDATESLPVVAPNGESQS